VQCSAVQMVGPGCPPHPERVFLDPAEGGPVPPLDARLTTWDHACCTGRPVCAASLAGGDKAGGCREGRCIRGLLWPVLWPVLWRVHELRQVGRCLQGGLLKAAREGDVGKVHRCLAAGVSVNCTDEVGAFSLLPMPAGTVEAPACSNSGGGAG
jgi:hypothetical protein